MRKSVKLPNLPPAVTALLAVLALIGASVAVTVTLVDSNGDGTPDTVEVTVNAAKGDGHDAVDVEAPAPLVKAAGTALEQDLEARPVGSPTPSLAQKDREAEVSSTVNELPVGGAVQGFAGCSTRILPANYSSRNGARPSEFVLHYTVSRNVPGLADVNAIVNLFANPGRQASSNFVIDAEGNCAYIVPIEAKAWTQAGGNPWSISVEVVAYGNETAYLEPAGWAKLRSVARQVSQRTGIPLRRGAVSSGCTPIRSGIVQHKDFGLCGGGHVDITPFSVDQAVAYIAGDGEPATPLTKVEQRIARGSCKPKGTGHSARYWRGRARRVVRRLDAAHDAGRPWKFHRIGARRLLLARAAVGKCG